MPDDKNDLLSDLKRNKKNRRLDEVCKVLRAFGFTERKASKEGSLWRKGSVTLTLPTPHGGERILKVPYVGLVVREIEKAEAMETAEEGKRDE